MRVLWFSNTPSLAWEHLTGKPGVGGGWIESLEKHILESSDIDLAVAFPWKVDKLDTFQLENRKYYAFPDLPRGKWERMWRRMRNQIQPIEEVEFFRHIIKEFKPDLIHIFGSERNYGLVIPEFNIPNILYFQGNLSVYTYRWFQDITKEELWKFNSLGEKLTGRTWMHKYWRYLKAAEREREIFSNTQYVIGRTDWDRRVSKALAPQAQYFHCDAIMRSSFYTGEEKRWEVHTREKLVILTTIISHPYKGMGALFDTMATLKAKADFPIEWRIAGVADDDKIVKIIKKGRGLDPDKLNIKLLGRKKPNELVDELIHADIYIHPTNIENESNAIIEAQLVGTPVIGTYAGGVATTIEDKVNGILVQDKDPYAMAGAILELYHDKEFCQQMSINAMRMSRERNDPLTVFKTLMNIYTDILSTEDNVVRYNYH